MKNNSIFTKKIALMGILCALALSLSFLENLIPPLPFVPPGAKPGFSNIATMFSLSELGFGYGIVITLCKAIFSGITRGFVAFATSLFGGVLSTIIAFCLFKWKKNPFGYVGIGIVSAVFHNIGQLLAVMIFTQTSAVIGYLPVLIVFAILTGFVTGTVLKVILPIVKKRFKLYK